MSKWIGAASWSAKEARAGDRLPYARLVDEHTLLLRDGSVMTAIQVPGLLFETEDSESLNAHAATREVVLRSTLDTRFVLYHHVIRRRVEVELDADFDDPLDAISARASGIKSRAQREAQMAQTAMTDGRFSHDEARALDILGLGLNADRAGLRRRYSELVRRYHPDRNGGDRKYEKRLSQVVEAYQLLRKSAGIA